MLKKSWEKNASPFHFKQRSGGGGAAGTVIFLYPCCRISLPWFPCLIKAVIIFFCAAFFFAGALLRIATKEVDIAVVGVYFPRYIYFFLFGTRVL